MCVEVFTSNYSSQTLVTCDDESSIAWMGTAIRLWAVLGLIMIIIVIDFITINVII